VFGGVTFFDLGFEILGKFDPKKKRKYLAEKLFNDLKMISKIN